MYCIAKEEYYDDFKKEVDGVGDILGYGCVAGARGSFYGFPAFKDGGRIIVKGFDYGAPTPEVLKEKVEWMFFPETHSKDYNRWNNKIIVSNDEKEKFFRRGDRPSVWYRSDKEGYYYI